MKAKSFQRFEVILSLKIKRQIEHHFSLTLNLQKRKKKEKRMIYNLIQLIFRVFKTVGTFSVKKDRVFYLPRARLLTSYKQLFQTLCGNYFAGMSVCSSLWRLVLC